jgi:hypothetical protein
MKSRKNLIRVLPCLVLLVLCASASVTFGQQERGLVRYGNLIVRHRDIAAIVVNDPRPEHFALTVYCRQSTGEIGAIPGADVASSMALWRAFETIPTPQQRQTGLVKCGELLIVRSEAISAVVRRDVPDKAGTIAQVVLQLDSRAVSIDFVENIKSREQLMATWMALSGLAEY